ncbi:VOC family protein [Sandarakinorhabdus sp.]|uniref:VOC family protein n=1 Tax=Sandarakinorhabdus sp. TaxID=1916663 RepID=UPI003F725D16
MLAGALLAAFPAASQSEKNSKPTVIQPMISWFEIPVTDLARARRFYEAVFAIAMSVERVDGYDMAFFPGDGTPGGALVQGDVYVPGKSGPILYFRVVDIDVVMARAVQSGGRSLYAKKDIGANGWVAEFEDSEGNRIALSQPR